MKDTVWGRVAALVLCSVLFVAPSSGRAAEPVDLELMLAVDVSGSVDADEALLQRGGYLKALVDAQVLSAIADGEHKKIAVSYFEWASPRFQRVKVDWTVIKDRASAEAFVAKLALTDISAERWTSISGAIEYAITRFQTSPYRGSRRVLDISGDGRNNVGRELAEVRAEALALGVTINGLPIVNDRISPLGTLPQSDVDTYYRDHVIGGPDSFYIVAEGFGAFAKAILHKLVREIANQPASLQVAGWRHSGRAGVSPGPRWIDYWTFSNGWSQVLR